ncbi:MAG: OmpA family protein [Flavobacteriales bacterium]|nr:OmpA family protein [Flavobacteriales bacterium]
MDRTWTLPVALLLASGLLAQSPSRLTVHFALDKAEPLPADAAMLRALCERPDAARITAITLTGHTDLRGSDAYNTALSERRAEAVQDLLRSTCLRDRPVRIAWSGEQEPLATGDDGRAHASNRRVEVEFAFAPEPVAVRPDAHPTVRPLMPTIDKPRERHTVDPSAPIDVLMSDGVRVRIPAAAIVDAKGLPVNGPVELSYRSFSEPYEIIASGIPMHLGAGADAAHFETAGMYELYALRGDEQLSLAPGASITLERPDPTPIDPGFTGWVLDPASGAWAAGGTITNPPAQGAPIAPVSSAATEATTLYWNTLWELEREKRPDTNLFAERRAMAGYCHLVACDTTALYKSWKRRRDRFDQVAGVPEITVVGYKGIYDPDHIVFTVNMDRVSDRQFPEWRRLPYPAIWEYRGDAGKAMFKRLYGRRHKYQDLVLDLKPGEDEGVLRLKENGQWLEIPVSAHWNRDTRARTQRWDRALALANKSLAKQERSFDRQVVRRTERYMKEHADMPATAWKKARNAMNESEIPMDLTAWRTYADTRRPFVMRDNKGLYEDLAVVRTTFGLDGFGVYNIDRIMKMAEQQNVLAEVKDSEGRNFPWVSGFAVLKNERSVITYWGSGSGSNDNFLVSPGRMRSLFLVDAEGRIAEADVDPLNSDEPRATLMVKYMGTPESIEQLRATAQR